MRSDLGGACSERFFSRFSSRAPHSSNWLRGWNCQVYPLRNALRTVHSFSYHRIWHANTYRLETTLNYGLERVWTICCLPGSNNIALGYDEGSIMIKLGREEPAISMDQSGKIIWAKHSEIQQANLKALPDSEIKDGERLPLAIKDMGACEIYPQTVAHNPNGRYAKAAYYLEFENNNVLSIDLLSFAVMGNT